MLRIIALWLAKLFQQLAVFFGKMAIGMENWYYNLTEMGRA